MPKLNYDDEKLQHILDDEGNAYTPEQVHAATSDMVKDESGQGSMGGLTEDDNGQHLTTAETPTPAEPATGAKRELNPLHFGDFFKSNIFGGIKARDYVTGKRPMTLFDYGTDVLSAYGGEDLGKRNSGFLKDERDAAAAKEKSDLTQSRIQTNKLNQQKTGLETEKLAGDAIQKMMHDLDADLWPGELKDLQKTHGLQLRSGVVGMVQRMSEKLHEAGVQHPADVLENPDKYDPALVNRVRHTMTILNKDVEESQGRQLEQEQKKQALGLRPGEEKRKGEKYAQEQTGVEDAIDLLTQQMADMEDPGQRRQVLGKIAALRQGGTTAQKVLEQLSGSAGPAPQGREWQVTRDAAVSTLKKKGNTNPSPDEVKEEMNRIEASGAAQKTEATKVAGLVADGKTQAARALGQLSVLHDFGKRVLTTNTAESYIQPIEFLVKRAARNEDMARLQAIPGTLSNLSRALGEKGVLTEPDLERISKAVLPSSSDTWQTYNARLEFVQEMITRGQAALEEASRTGRIVPVDGSDITFEGDPLPPKGAGGKGGGGDKKAMAAQWSARIKAEQDPAKKDALRQQARQELAS